jgi:hypothetical protein
VAAAFERLSLFTEVFLEGTDQFLQPKMPVSVAKRKCSLPSIGQNLASAIDLAEVTESLQLEPEYKVCKGSVVSLPTII